MTRRRSCWYLIDPGCRRGSAILRVRWGWLARVLSPLVRLYSPDHWELYSPVEHFYRGVSR